MPKHYEMKATRNRKQGRPASASGKRRATARAVGRTTEERRKRVQKMRDARNTTALNRNIRNQQRRRPY